MIGSKGVETVDKSIVIYILWNLINVAGIYLGTLLTTWICFTEAVKMFHLRCGPGPGGIPCDWWDYPFIPVFGYFVITLFVAFVAVWIAQIGVENILEALRSAELINF